MVIPHSYRCLNDTWIEDGFAYDDVVEQDDPDHYLFSKIEHHQPSTINRVNRADRHISPKE